ncbi:co-chaperone DjlA [Pseudohongiella sp.]|uniref:J domain-containing protein n=1 Tax=marine sediment metagenome TaxID=412755 RepID=A0A0F9V1J0_9ZZZZ|nr:co-chaperone DjlA [Pseudohongiella sp.]HDZ08911.1 co-chaperone DjlA [Pseudohongiella sp.]HEA64011.1 co-chaperone DjlA [Pseudohongiella sp.]
MFAVLLGGFVGSLMGGPLGLVVGAVAGWFLSAYLRKQAVAGLSRIQSGFLDSMFAVMGALCKADGVVTPNEVQAAEAVFTQMRLSAQQREMAIAAFNRGKETGFDLDAELARFRQISRGHPAMLRMFLQIQISAVAADGQIHPAEHKMLLHIARGLGLPESQVAQLEAMLRGGQRGGSGRSPDQQLADAYQVLGVSASISDPELKRAYRKLMNENHPDKLASQGLPDSMREIAERKTRDIASAYDLIRDARRQ